MEKVIITSTRIFFAKWDREKEVWEKTDITKLDKPISWFLPHVVEVGEGVTFEDFLRLLEKFEDQVNLIFAGYLENCKLGDFLKELDEDPEEDLTNLLDHVEFYWNINLIEFDDEIAEFRLRKFPSFRGVLSSAMEDDDDDDLDIDDSISLIIDEIHDLSLVPLKNYKLVPIAINDFAEFLDSGEESTGTSLLDASLDWTFFDFISAMFTELSLYGTPKEKEKVAEEVKATFQLEDAPIVMEAKEIFEYLDTEGN